MKQKYIIQSFNKGFYTVKRPDGIIENMSEKKLKKLQKDINNTFIKVNTEILEKKEDVKSVAFSNKNKLEELKLLNKPDLIEIATRLGLKLANNEIMKKQELIEYIIKKYNG